MTTPTAAERTARRYLQNKRRRLQAIGEWQSPYVDAEPVRQHVWAIRAAGMSEKALERRFNLPEGAFKNLIRGANGKPPGSKVLRTTADTVLAYWPTLQDFPDTASIDPTGTRRRAHALQALGWPNLWMAEDLGMRPSNFRTCLRTETVSARFARKIAALYDRLWNQNPEDHGVPAHAAARTRRHAEANGYLGPMAWDDDTIDDPKAMPQTDALEPVVTEGENVADRWLMGESVLLSPQDRRQVVQHLFEWTNDTPEEIAARLEMSLDAVWQTWTRLKKKARDEGRAEPWRRVYVPRERSLKQDDMEEVA
ncbi:hypothetical protein AB0454_22640 [Streptomyces sp. NPDC093509]|uniref:hypothetical protein n=1 Tax=Streptomyces sp. NPDC093509 TaxID=3154982 RepID=UPI00344E37D5